MSGENYIGMDIHQATISVAVMRFPGQGHHGIHLETKASTILDFFAGLRGTLSVTFEEGTSPSMVVRFAQAACGLLDRVQSAEEYSAQTGQTRVIRSMLANSPIGYASMTSSRSTTVTTGYACCGNWRAVI
jgi:hypothetical protein